MNNVSEDLPIDLATNRFALDFDIGIFWTYSSKEWIPDALDSIKSIINALEPTLLGKSPQTMWAMTSLHDHFESLILAVLRKEVSQRLS